jgi:hypothetical protein
VRVLRPVSSLLGVLALVGLGVVAATPASATAEPTSACTPTSGVIVAVDFSHWGGPLLRSCGTTPTTGYTLLNQGGWRSTGTLHDGPGFICRIGYAGYAGGTQYPTPATEACQVTPPASAYWSYWRAAPGQDSWSYSQVGPTGDRPAPGTVELWTFGATNVAGTEGAPKISPAALRAKVATPTTKPTHSTAHSTLTPQATAPAAGSTGTSGPTTSPTGSPAASVSTAPSTGASAGTASTAGTSVAAPVDAPPATDRSSGGSPLPLLGGLGLVVLVGGAGGLARWRRRSQ